MSPAPKRKPTKKPAAPLALAKNAARVATRAKQVNETRARELVALVQEKLGEAAAAFYDVGVALLELAEPALFTALGYRTFPALVKTELGFSIDKAKQLMAVARGMKRTTALKLGAARAAAVVELAAATPENDTPEQVATGSVRVRGPRAPVRPREMSARAIEQAARVERRSHRTTKATDAERAAAEARLAKVTARLRKRDAHATLELIVARREGEHATPTVRLTASLAAFEALLRG